MLTVASGGLHIHIIHRLTHKRPQVCPSCTTPELRGEKISQLAVEAGVDNNCGSYLGSHMLGVMAKVSFILNRSACVSFAEPWPKEEGACAPVRLSLVMVSLIVISGRCCLFSSLSLKGMVKKSVLDASTARLLVHYH